MDLGAAAFWIFLAAIIIAGIWRKKHSEAMKHETVRFLIEKNQKLDDKQLAELLNPPPPPSPEWLMPKRKPGDGCRVMRVCGTLLVFIALGLLIADFWRGMVLGIDDKSVLGIATAIPFLAMLGIGLLVASRFVTQPSKTENRDK
jgi:hypothetical protein